MNLRGTVVPRAELHSRDRAAMLGLLDRHFEGVDEAVFERDLAEKDRVILLHDDENALRAFSTIMTFESADGQTAGAFSGDTIVDRGAWGSTALPRTWLEAVLPLQAAYRARVPRGRFYWLLISSGFRTYRFLPVYFRNFWPRYDAKPDPESAELLERLAIERFGARFRDGIVRLDRPHRLRSPEIEEGRMQNPHVAYFARCNPGHARGDELVCLTEIAEENLTAAGLRVLTSIRAGAGCAA
jgi:hypothetical protein